jgi:WD40 repeat protein
MRISSFAWSRASRPTARRARSSRYGTVVTASLEDLEARWLLSGQPHDILYIGDAGDNTIKEFDASTGAYLGTLVASGGGGLDGPRGLIFRNPGQLLVSNQNVDQSYNGEIDRFNGKTGNALSPVVPHTNPNGPFAPRGMVLRDNILYVANLQDNGSPSGEIREYSVSSGKFLGTLLSNFPVQFNPRGVVFGPDGMLYVTANQESDFSSSNNEPGGIIVRVNPNTGAYTVVASDPSNAAALHPLTTITDLHRPEGLTFGPDGSLYVTAFRMHRSDLSDTDKILALNATTGALKDEILLDSPGQPHTSGQAIEFGPDGKLFLPLTSGADIGSVREYDVHTHTFTVFVPSAASGGPLVSPWYLTFGETDPSTLAYEPDHQESQGTAGDASDPVLTAGLALFDAESSRQDPTIHATHHPGNDDDTGGK